MDDRLNSACSWIRATTTKNVTSRAVNGNASSNACPSPARPRCRRGRGQHDDPETDEAHLRHVQRQARDQEHRATACAPTAAAPRVALRRASLPSRHDRAQGSGTRPYPNQRRRLHHDRGDQTGDEHRQGDRALRHEELEEAQPAASPITRFCGSPTSVHSPPSAVPTAACIIRLRRRSGSARDRPRSGRSRLLRPRDRDHREPAARRHPVIHGVEARCDRDHDGHHRQRVEERREHRRGPREGQREQDLGTDRTSSSVNRGAAVRGGSRCRRP